MKQASRCIGVLGIPVDNLTLKKSADRIFEMIDAFREDRRTRQVATVNVDFLVNTYSGNLGEKLSEQLLKILRNSDMVTADGMPIVWLSRLLGCGLEERVAGADLTPLLIEQAALKGQSVYFLGGSDNIGAVVSKQLQEKLPALKIAGYSAPIIDINPADAAVEELNDAMLVEEINRCQPDILFVALGNPKQEIWIARNLHRLEVPVAIGIGGTLEFMSGRVSRAPLWVQDNGLEWIYRILQEPGRLWKRYWQGLFAFAGMTLPLMSAHLWNQFSGKKSVNEAAMQDFCREVHWKQIVISLPAVISQCNSEPLIRRINDATACYEEIRLDCGQTTELDIAGIGSLLKIYSETIRAGKTISFVNVKPAIRRMFELHRIADLHIAEAHLQLQEEC